MTAGHRITWTICAVEKIESHLRDINHPQMPELLEQFDAFVRRLGEIDERFIGLTAGMLDETDEQRVERLMVSCSLARAAEGRRPAKLEAFEELANTLDAVGAA